jgi:hypothetical protein
MVSSGSNCIRNALLLGIILAGMSQGRAISKATARKLVHQAVIAMGKDSKGVQIDTWEYRWAPQFYTFSASWPPEKPGPLLVYYFAVNASTGDVWEAMECRRITSPVLQKEQELIWSRSWLPANSRQALQNKSPACSPPAVAGNESRER